MNNKLIILIIILVSPKSTLGQIDFIDNNFNSFYYSQESELWISSQGGWNRYNGKNTKHYLVADSLSGLKGTWVQSGMKRDRNDLLWTSTYEYLCCFNQITDAFNCFHPVINGDTIKEDIRVIQYQFNNNSLIIQAGKGLFELSIDEQNYRPLISDFSTNSIVFNEYVKGENAYIFGSAWTKNQIFEILKFEKEEWSNKLIDFSDCKNELKDIQISDVIFTDDNIWLIANLGLVLLNKESPCLSNIFRNKNSKHSYVQALEFQGNLLITSDFEGLLIFSLEEEKFIKQIKNDDLLTPLLNNSPVEISESEHDVYVSFRNKGVQQISKSKLNTHLLFKQRTHSLKQQQSIIGIKNILILTDLKENIFVLNDNYELKDIINLKISSVITDIIVQNDIILYSDENSIWKYDLANKLLHKIFTNESIKINRLENHEDQLFVVASNKLYNLEGTELKLLTSYQNETIDNEIIHFKVISDDCFLYTKASEVIINQNGVEKTIKTNSYIYDLTYNKDENEILLALGDGLGVITLPSLHFRKTSIHNERIEGIYPFEKGAYILESSKGIFILDIKNKIRRIYTNNEEVINSTLFNDYFIYLTQSGIHSILKTDLLSKQSDSIFISSSSIPYKRKKNQIFFQYSYKDNPPELSLTTSSIKNNENGIYSYHLDFNNKIGTADLSENLSLPILSEGSHTLIIQGYYLDLTKSNQIKIHIRISGPWWRQWWFVLFFISTVILGAWYYIRLRSKRYEKEIRVKEEIYSLEKSALQAQMNPHFIFNCLNSIQNFIMDNDKENAMDYLGRFAQLIRSNLNASLKDKITLFEEVKILDNYLCLEQLRLNNKFSYQIDLPNDLDLYDIYLPPMLIQPFVENSVIHGMKNVKRDGNISISITVLKSIMNVVIKDNGVNDLQNLETNHSHKSVGVSITNKRLAFINNTPKNKIETNLDITASGTSVFIHISLEDS